MKKLSKLMALLLALVLVLSTGVGAVAETTIDTKDEYYDAALKAMKRFLASFETDDTLTWGDYWDIAQQISEEDFEEFFFNDEYLTNEERANIYEYMTELFWDSCISYTKVGPFIETADDGVAAVSTYGLRTLSDEYAVSTVDDTSGVTTDGLIVDKNAELNEDGTAYTVTLETYVTGKVTTTTTTSTKPCDIVLVLDFSGSMTEEFSGAARLAALQTAVNSFIDQVRLKYTDTANHRITLITFNSGATIRNDWTFVKDDNAVNVLKIDGDPTVKNYGKNQTGNLTSELKAWTTRGTDTGTGVASALEQLQGNSYLNTDGDDSTTNYLTTNGTANTISLVNNDGQISSGEGRSKVVVVFTDGIPDSTDQAVSAVNNAASIKDLSNTTVYSVAIFSGANPETTISSWTFQRSESATTVNPLMHAISSNYPDATATTSGNNVAITPGSGGNNGYYLTASSADDLEDIFVKISSNIQSATSSVELGAQTVIEDIITPYFKLPAGADASSLKFYTAQHTGDTTDTAGNTIPTFGTATQITDGSVTASFADDLEGIETEDNKTLHITGFDFAENAVSTTTNNGKTSYNGKKLIITFDVVPEPDFLGGNDVITNSAAGVYAPIYAEDGTTITGYEKKADYPDPDVDVTAKKIENFAEDQHIYLTNSVDLLKLLGLDDANDYLEYTLNGTTYKVDGVNNAYVDITYTFKDASGNTIATYTIGKGQTSGTLTYAKDSNGNTLTAPMITSDTTYTIECLVDAGTKNGVSNSASSSDTATVYVYKPVLTFKDTEEKYDTEMAEASETDYYNATDNNLVSEKWMHDNTEAGTQMSGTKPTLTLTYSTTTKNGTAFDWLDDTTKKVVGEEDAYVNVTKVMSAGDETREITSDTKAVRNVCGCTHKDATNCANTEVLTAEAMGNTPEFIVHIYDVYGQLKINKVVQQDDFAGGTFTFTVTGPNSYSSTQTITLASGTNNGSVTVSNLLPGSYTVTESTPTGYTVSGSPATATVAPNQTVEVTITNTANSNYEKVVTKIWDDNGNALGYRPDSIALTLSGDNKTYTNANITPVKNGNTWTYTFTVPKYDASGNTIKYTVSETQVDGYKAPTYNQDTLTVTNSINVGHLKITKTVVNDTGITAREYEFEIQVDLTDANGTALTDTFKYTIGTDTTEYNIESGETITLKNGEYATIKELPPETKYTVSESAPAGFTASVATTVPNDTEGKIDAGKTDEVTVTNTFAVTSLTITKEAGANTTIGTDETFIIKVTKQGTTEETTVVINGAGSVTLTDLYIGDTYTIAEDGNWSWRYDTTTYSASEITLAAGGNTVTVTNTKTDNQWIDGEDSVVNTWDNTGALTNDEN